MRHAIAATIAAFCILFGAGCGNLSPRQDQDINNQNGKIGEIENLANSIKAEVGTIKSQQEIQNSRLDRIQQGLANFQTNYDNSGVAILSGPGGLGLGVLIVMCLSIVALYYRKVAGDHEKVANLLAAQIALRKDNDLEDKVFQAALFSDVEENVLRIMKKHLG